jgi:O-antigen/teichoic acid export membrane protein
VTSNTNTRQITRNAAANYLTLITQLVSGLVVTPLLFRGLGESAFGTYALLVNILGYVGFLELGVGTATLRLVAVESATQGTDRIGEVLSSSRSLYLPIIAVSTLAYLPIAVFAPRLPGASGASDGDVRLVIAALAVSQLFALLMNVYPAYIYGTGRADVLFGLGAVINIVMSAAQIAVATTDGGIKALAAATAVITALNVLLLSRIARRMLGNVRARAKDADPATRTQLLRVGVKNAGVGILATLSQQSDLVIVGVVLPASRVAAYALASRAAAFAKTIATRATDVLVPTFADASARKDDARLSRLIVEAAIFGSAVLYPLAAICVLFGHELLLLWVGTVPAQADLVLALLMLAAAVQTIGAVGFAYFTGRGEVDVFLRSGGVVAVANLAASVVLVNIVGVTGPAISTLVAIIVFDALILPRAMARSLNQRTRDLFGALPPALGPPLLLTCFDGILVKLTVDSPSLRAAIGGVSMAVVFYATLAVCVGSERRQTYARLVRSRA